MLDFLFNLYIDRFSFIVGFIAGIAFSFAIWSLRSNMPLILERIKAFRTTTQKKATNSFDDRYRKEMLTASQSLHLTNSLFSLDEIIVTPRLLAPPPLPLADGTFPTDDTFQATVPYMPDWPEFSAQFSMPTLSIAEALQGGLQVGIIGQPGAGKTTALAHFTCQLARKDYRLGNLSEMVPIFVHVNNLGILEGNPPKDPLSPIISAAQDFISTLNQSQVPGYLRNAVSQRQAILILDGADGLSPALLPILSNYLRSLLKLYPGLRLVIAASPEYLNGLTQLGIVPMALTAWGMAQREQFIRRWDSLWNAHIAPKYEEQGYLPVETQYFVNWILAENPTLTPLEITLKTWALYAGDVRGGKVADAVESHIHRSIRDPQKRTSLERLALQMILKGQTMITGNQANALVTELTKNTDTAQSKAAALVEGAVQLAARSEKKASTIRQALPEILDSGLLVEYKDGLGFSQPLFIGYLASLAITNNEQLNEIINAPTWPGKIALLRFMASIYDITQQVESLIAQDVEDPLHRNLLMVARCLSETPSSAPWRGKVMRRLAELLQKPQIPRCLRTRAMAAFVTSGDPSVSILIQQLINQPSPEIRQIGLLACGAALETKQVNAIIDQLADYEPLVRQGACLALLAINNPQTAEAISVIFQQGDEGMGRIIAETMANRPETGHSVIKQSSFDENLLVRRAAVFGLQKIQDRWASDILEKISIEDGQWVVRNAAVHALENRKKPSPYAPHPLVSPHESTWLLTKASAMGTGISPGTFPTDMFLQILKEGTLEEQLASIDYLRLLPSPSAGVIGAMYHLYFTDEPILQEAAFTTLWFFTLSGAVLPSTKEFGLG